MMNIIIFLEIAQFLSWKTEKIKDTPHIGICYRNNEVDDIVIF